MSGLEKSVKTLHLYCGFYDPTKLEGERKVIQVKLDTAEGEIVGYYELSKDKCHFNLGESSSPDVVFEAHIYDFHDLANGISTLDEVLERENVKVSGEVDLLRRLSELFSKTLDPYELGYWSREWEEFGEWKRPNKILVLNGSGRRRDGITWAFLEPFVDGMREAGAEVELIDIYDPNLKIEPCHGCFACQAFKVAACVYNDDGKRILEKFRDYELTVFAFPVYLFSTPAKLKALLDRMFVELQPYFIEHGEWTRHPLWFRRRRYMAVLAISGYPEKKVFEPLNTTFEWLAREAHAKLVAKIFRSGAWIYKLAPQFEKYYKIISEALREAGRQLVERGYIDRELVEKIEREYVPKKAYYRINNAFWYSRYKKMGVDPRKILEENL